MNDKKNDDNNSTTSVDSLPKEEESTSLPDLSSSVVTKLASDDVLMGRGAAVIGNEGNRRFRKLIQKYKTEYDATRIRQEKDRIARRIVETIKSRNGRFLKKIDTPTQAEFFKVPAGKAAWVIVKEAVVLQKVKQAFRDDRRALEEEKDKMAKNNIPASLKNAYGGIQNSPMSIDSLAGRASLAGYRSFENPSLFMHQDPTPAALGLLNMTQPQQLVRVQLDQQMLSQLVAARQAQLTTATSLDPLAALRLRAASEQAIMDENRRVMLLRQVLARQSALPPPPMPSELAALRHRISLREQLALMGSGANALLPTAESSIGSETSISGRRGSS